MTVEEVRPKDKKRGKKQQGPLLSQLLDEKKKQIEMGIDDSGETLGSDIYVILPIDDPDDDIFKS